MINKVSESYKHNILSLIFGPFLKIIEAFFDLLIPLIMKAIIDLVQYNSPSLIPNNISRFFAYIIRGINQGGEMIYDAITGGAIILIMGIIGYSITMTAQYIAARTSVNIGSEIRESLYAKILSLPIADREKIGSNKIITVFNSDTAQIQQATLLFVRLIIRAPFILLGSLIFSFILDWKIGLSFLGIVPLIILINYFVLRKTSKTYVELQSNLDAISSNTGDMTSGARVIRAGNKEESENAKFAKNSEKYAQNGYKINKFNSLINPLTFAVTSLAIIIIIFLLKDVLFMGGEVNTLAITTIIAEMYYLSLIFFVTVQITQSIIEVVKGYVSSKRIDEILTLKPSIIKNGNIYKDDDFEGPLIRFNNVSFSFSNDINYFLKDLNFEIRKGETFAIIGGTGSGKSTIAHLLERFYDTTDGEILYKGIPLRQYDLHALREDIGLVNQKSSLFKGTIKSNYLISKPDASDEEIVEAIKKAEAYEFVNKYPDGINHYVNEGGSNFSGGQKQRLCIGRALIKQPDILILDDATSALDLLTDKRIRTTISSLKNMTKIIISQRVATIQNADYILVIHGGKVMGLGKHDDLLSSCPMYRDFYLTQLKQD